MTHIADITRRFRVHARHIDVHHARLLHATSFETAAVAYLEDFHVQAPLNEEDEISFIVHEVETGQQHCFKVDLRSGETSPCG